jgi:hypothetical protein
LEFLLAKFDQRMAGYDEQTRYSGVIYVLMLVLAAAFAGFVWNLYSGREAPRIAAPPGAYKVEPAANAANHTDAAEENALYGSLEGREESAAATPRPAPEAPMPEAPPARPSGAPQLAPMPSFAANGPYVAQVAALQSEAAVQPAWTRLASRAPGLFDQARLDVERADLGQRGIYYRVRAGYFADRANAHRFCERIEQMGQDCIVVQR